MKVHELASELRCTVSDIQRTARELDISAPTPAFELRDRDCRAIREHGVLTLGVLEARRAAVIDGACPEVPEPAFQPASLPFAQVREAPAKPVGRGAVRLLVHQDVSEWLYDEAGSHKVTRKRAELVIRQFLGRGLPNNIKPVTEGASRGWRRTRLGGHGGNQFYLWWAPAGAPPTKDVPLEPGSVLLRAVRHHDLTSDALDPGGPDSWIEFSAADTEQKPESPTFPFSHEQANAACSRRPARLIRGYPGSGKTTALQMALPYCEGHRTLYLTYSKRLAAEALKEVAAFGVAGTSVDIITFSEFLDEFGEVAHPATIDDTYSWLSAALAEVRDRRGTWENRVPELYAEMHAHLLGRSLPIAFARAEESAAPVSLDRYRNERVSTLGEGEVKVVASVAKILEDRGQISAIFAGPVRAHNAVRAFVNGAPPPPRFDTVSWILVDEVQDLTLVEQLLVVELCREVARKNQWLPGLLFAGDEGQTVRPTDFEWGPLADLVHARLGVYPENHTLSGNVRSPRNIATVVNRSWNLYKRIQKEERPRGYSWADIDETAVGRVIRCRADGPREVEEVLRAFEETPGSAVIYPGFRIPESYRKVGTDIWTSETAKGLDFQIVCVLDVGARLLELDALAATENPLHRIWARTMADQIRVALSRPTDTLVLLDVGEEPEQERSVARLLEGSSTSGNANEVDGLFPDMTANELKAVLASEDIDAEAMVTAWLADVRKVLQDDPPQAYRKAVQACGWLGRTTTPGHVRDESLRREAWALRALTAGLVALDSTDPDQTRLLFQSANRYFREAELTAAANAMTALRRVREFHPEDARSVVDLLEAVPHILRNAPDLELRMVHVIVEWAKAVAIRPLPPADAKRADLDRAVQRLTDQWGERRPELVGIRERVRQQIARSAMDEGKWKIALEFLENLATPDHASTARCHEELGDFGRAAELWEAADDSDAAIRCARAIPDLERVVRLASIASPEIANRARWLLAFGKVADDGTATVGVPLTAAEREWARAKVEAALGAHGTSTEPAPRRRGRATSRVVNDIF